MNNAIRPVAVHTRSYSDSPIAPLQTRMRPCPRFPVHPTRGSAGSGPCTQPRSTQDTSGWQVKLGPWMDRPYSSFRCHHLSLYPLPFTSATPPPLILLSCPAVQPRVEVAGDDGQQVCWDGRLQASGSSDSGRAWMVGAGVVKECGRSWKTEKAGRMARARIPQKLQI